MDMRASEAIHIVVFGYFMVLAWARPLPVSRRVKVTGIGIAALAANTVSAALIPRLLPRLAASVVRDWLPAALLLVVYWVAGAFFTRIDQRFQDRLERIDARFAAPWLHLLYRRTIGRWAATVFETAYLLCYAMVPMALGTIYLLRRGGYADSFWTVVLISTYLCYGALPFLQALPPRMLEEKWLDPLPLTPVRKWNLWMLRNASIHANTFPSAHVAASSAAALVLLALSPWPAGVLFAAIAVCIAFGTVTGRYHYGSDAVVGCGLAVVVFLVVRYLRAF
jgi:membrane-associated phospholipid phosphatase